MNADGSHPLAALRGCWLLIWGLAPLGPLSFWRLSPIEGGLTV